MKPTVLHGSVENMQLHICVDNVMHYATIKKFGISKICFAN